MKIIKLVDTIGINILPSMVYIPKRHRGGCLGYKLYIGWLNLYFYIE